MKKSILIFTIIALFTLASQAQYFGTNKARYKQMKFKVAQSPNFELYHYFKKPSTVERILQNSEHWASLHKQIFGKVFAERNPLIIYKNHPDFQETTAIDGEIGEGTGGVTEGFKNRVVQPMMYSHRQTDHVLGHELVHAFQYDMMKTGDSTSLESIQNLPLWMVEGLAEFMSIGKIDSHTSMWLRDAVQKKDLPALKDLNNFQKYFPYRWGQAFWAYISGTYGDDKIKPLFQTTASEGLESALQTVLNTDSKTFSTEWQRVINETYEPYKKSLVMEPVGNIIANEKNAGSMNISPSISPNGQLIAYISERNLISLDIYIADANTGKILKSFNIGDNKNHVDAVNFLETAGAWSPNSQTLAYVVQSKGKNKLMTLDVASGNKKVYELKGVDAFVNPAWSPTDNKIVVSGLMEGESDLYLYDLDTDEVKNLTNDINSDMMPTWSPDGKSIFFVSDRSDNAPRLEKAFYNISKYDLVTGKVQNYNFLPKADNLNPAVDGSGQLLYFVSDADGFRNLYRYNLTNNALEKLTNFFTGVSGVTMYSPAISVAQKADKIVYTLFKNSTYNLYSASAGMFASYPLDANNVNRRISTLPPIYANESSNIVQANLEKQNFANDIPSKDFKEKDYKSKFKLDYIGTTGVGVGVNNQYGAGLNGAVQAIFSDVLGNHQLQGALAMQGDLADIGGQLMYLNQKKPFQWGIQVSHIPYSVNGQKLSDDSVSVSGSNGKPIKIGAQKLSNYKSSQFNNTIDGFAFFPFNTHQRLEAGAGLNWVSFKNSRTDEYYDYADNLLGSKKEKLPADDSYQFQMAHVAYVGDNSTFGLTSPLNGYRYRFEARQIFGVIKVTNYLADVRKYKYLRPFSIAGRFLFNARNGTDAETQSLSPLFIGNPGYVRGYYGKSLNRQLDRGVDIAQLLGTRMAVANFEVRLPLSGPKKLALIKSGIFLTDLNFFADLGGSWKGSLLGANTKTEKPATLSQGLIATSSGTNIVDKFRYDPVASTGISLRVNVFGYLIVEPYYAVPIHSGKIQKGGFGINLVPGW